MTLGAAILASVGLALAAPLAPPGGQDVANPAPRAPLPPPGFMQGCLKLIEQQRYDEARDLLEPVVGNHPGWARAHFYLALTYHKENRYEPAQELFARALQLDPEYHTPRVFHGWSLYYLGRLDEATSEFQTYLSVKPDYPDAIFALGLIDFDNDRLDAARIRFEETIALARRAQDPATEAKARARLADVHLRLGELAAAREELDRSIELNPANYETYFKLSRVLQRLGDAEGAAAARQMHDKIEAQRRAERIRRQKMK